MFATLHCNVRFCCECYSLVDLVFNSLFDSVAVTAACSLNVSYIMLPLHSCFHFRTVVVLQIERKAELPVIMHTVFTTFLAEVPLRGHGLASSVAAQKLFAAKLSGKVTAVTGNGWVKIVWVVTVFDALLLKCLFSVSHLECAVLICIASPSV